MDNVIEKVSNEYILKRINHIKDFVLKNKITSLGLDRSLISLYELRKALYAKNIDNNKEIIIKEAITFVSFQERLLIGRISRARFGHILRQMLNDYATLCKIDSDNILYAQCKNALTRVKTRRSFGLMRRALDNTIQKIVEVKTLKDSQNLNVK